MRSRAVRSWEGKSVEEEENAVRETAMVKRDLWTAKWKSVGVGGGKQMWG